MFILQYLNSRNMRYLFFLFLLFGSLSLPAQTFHLLIGTYTEKGSKGIYVYRFNAVNGTAEWVSNTDSAANPSYLAIGGGGKYVYAVNETGGATPGGVTAYSFDRSSGTLALLNQQPAGGDHPCYVTVSRNGKWVVVGNYTGGNLSALPVASDGSLRAPVQTVQHTGSGINKQRQEKAHVHATVFDPAQNYLLSPDLGTDKVMIYRFNPNSPRPLQASSPAFVSAKAGGGPRHLTFHPNSRFAYLIEELSGTVAAYRYSKGKLTLVQRTSSHPKGYTGAFGSADIHLSPDGKFLYASNRGEANNIAIFSVDKHTGKLTLKGHQSTLGTQPRNFMIDPTGNYLLVANQGTGSVVIFKRNPKTGLLRDTGKKIELSMPVCLKMVP